MRKRNLILPIMISLLCGYTAQTQDTLYHVALSAVTGGGGDAGNEFYSVQFTIAQPFQGESSSPYYSVSSGFVAAATLLSSTNAVTELLSSRWNIISVPLLVGDGRTSTLFPQAVSNAYAYVQGVGYQRRDTLNPGAGYWLKFSAPQVSTIVGLPRNNDTIEVVKGWNLIGSLSKTIGINGISTIPPDIRSSEFFQYDNSYQVADSLEPMAGYWINVRQDGSLVMGVSGSASPLTFSKPAYSKTLEKLNTLTIRDMLDNQKVLYFTSGDSSAFRTINRDLFDLPPLPPQGLFDVRFINNRFMNLFMKDLENQSIDILLQSEQFPLKISWIVDDSDSGRYILTDHGGSKASELKLLKGNGSITIDNPSLQRLTLIFNGKGSPNLPTKYSLRQNYPNPFNPTAIIEFDVPEEALVTLRVYDIVGREVVTLKENEPYETGTHQVEFNASRQVGIASGVYFYCISAQSGGKSFVDVKKMLLMK